MAEERVMTFQSQALAKIRQELKADEFKVHHALLNENREAIGHLDNQINQLMQKKALLVKKFSDVISAEIRAVTKRFLKQSKNQKIIMLKTELSLTLSQHDEQLILLQKQRAILLKDKSQIEKSLRKREIKQNDKLNELYREHGEYLEKLQVVHAASRLSIAKSVIEATVSIFDKLVMGPVKFLRAYFSPSENIDEAHSDKEIVLRTRINALETKLSLSDESHHISAQLSF